MSEAAMARVDAGMAFEAEVSVAFTAVHSDAVVLGGGMGGDERTGATTAAMAAGRHLIIGGRLPVDEQGRRVGEPDVLIRADRRPDGTFGYHPVDIKQHRTLGPRMRPADVAAMTAALDAPGFDAAALDDGWTVRSGATTRDDLLQLAHYYRLLEACGHAASAIAGGIIGSERLVTWYGLDVALIAHRWRRAELESALQRYDFEFSFRLDAVASAMAGAPIVEPVSISECGTCRWRSSCIPRLEAADSVSLLPGLGYVQWHAYRQLGIGSRAELASLDRRSALVRDCLPAGADVPGLLAAAATVDPATPVAALLGRARSQVQLLRDHGVVNAGDLLILDRRALATHGRPIGTSLAGVIDVARVAVAGRVLHRRRDVPKVIIPRADVEIDIDMENALDGTVYLWGLLLRDRYLPFVEWEMPSPFVEASVFASLWDWLTDVREAAAAAGQTVAVYCWHQDAELGALRTGARHAADLLGLTTAPEEVEAFLASGQLVDLLKVTRDHLESGASYSLKAIAPLAGFAWQDDDPSGDASMSWHRQATAHGSDAYGARRRLLAYNEDDVRATATLRRWLDQTTFPSLDDLDPSSDH